MKTTSIQGRVSFVNHEKQYAIIEYEENGKKKTLNTNIDEGWQKQLKEKNLIKRIHRFQIGDTVRFNIAISDRKDRMIATNVEYLYNTALDALLNKAKTDNKFMGYLKVAEGKYFVKEIESYLFFPVSLSPWQIKPTGSELNESVLFYLEDIGRKDKITARLLNNNYIQAFYSAVQSFKEKKPVEAVVYKVTPHGIYLTLFDSQIHSKLPVSTRQLQVGDKLAVIISYLSPAKIVVEEQNTEYTSE